MGKITSITPEQTARFPEWTDKWIKIGLSTEPCDFDTAIKAALKSYEVCKLEKPLVILKMQSPYTATLGGILAWALIQDKSMPVDNIATHIEAMSLEQLEKAVKANKTAYENKNQGVYNYRGGSLWASWAAYVSFFRDVMGWEDPVLEKFEIDEALVKSCGWIWWHEQVLSISDRPLEIHRDDANRLHNPSGPSIIYRDGWSLWNWHGVTVAKDIILNPDKITVKRIDDETNAELRRILIERYKTGEEINAAAAYIRDAGGVRLDYEEGRGTLWRREIPGDEAIVVLEVKNSTPEKDGTFKKYFLRVPPTITKAHDAAAWTFNLDPKDYNPNIET